MVEQAPTSLRKILFSAVVVCLFLLVLGIGEFVMRVQTPSRDFAKFLFFTEFKIDRWHYLSANMNIHQLDMVMASHPHIQYIEPPEANRPPFDQVPVEFHVQNNGDGFRDQEFNVDPRKKQIVVLGDSVVFGKGVTQEERFTSLLQEKMPNTQIFNLGLQGCTAECMAKLWDQYITKLQPEMLIIQASGNDLDQILYKESMEKRLPGLQLQSLELIQNSWLAQWFLYLRGADKVELQMESAKQAVINKQRSFIEAMYQSAAKQNIDIVIVNLPYAYEYYYGDHMMELCTVDTCKPEVRIDLSTYKEVSDNALEPIRTHSPDFVTKTAAQMSLSEEELALVFPQRDCFFDVVHLSPLGHAVVAEQLAVALQDMNK
jgi:lysophospholipase L1-like esterase